MVPGMTERERLATDDRRLEWLTDARIGPAHLTSMQGAPRRGDGFRPSLPIGLWRHGLSSVLVLGRRLRLTRPGTAELRPSIGDSTAG
jgi:hypothetical protein